MNNILKHKRIWLLFLLSIFQISRAVELNGVEVPKERLIYFLFIGHSNMSGYGGQMDIVTHPRVWMYNLETGFWNAHDPIGPFCKQSPSPVMPFMKKMAEYYPDYYFCGVKVTQPAWSMANHFLRGKDKYLILLEAVDSLKDVATLGGVLAMIGLCEGASDTNSAKLCDNVMIMLSSYREDFGVPDLPCIFGRYEENATMAGIPSYTKYRDRVIAQILTIPDADPLHRTELTPYEAIPADMYFDGHHYNENGYALWSNTAAEIIKVKGLDSWDIDNTTPLSLKYPWGGETFSIEETIPIIWSYNPDSLSQISIQLSLDTGNTWELISGETPLPAESGPFSWDPSGSGLDVIGKGLIIRIIDASENYSDTSQFFSIVIVNTPPEITSIPIITAKEGLLYTYIITATDADIGTNLTIDSTNLPAWLTLIDSGNGNGLLAGTPSGGHVGDNEVVLTVTDGVIDVPVEQQFTITVTANAVPEFTSFPVLYAKTGKPYTYNITTSDVDTEAQLTIAATTLPLWLTFTDNGNGTATLSGTPDTADLGDHANVLTVTDGIIVQPVEQSFTISTAFDSTLSLKYPRGGETFSIEDTIPIIWTYNPDSLSLILVHVSLDSGKTWELISGGTPLPAESDSFNWNPSGSGLDITRKGIIARITDNEGIYIEESNFFTIYIPNAAPEFTSTPIITAKEGLLYTYNITAIDADAGAILTIGSTGLPTWLVLTDKGDGTASLTGTPSGEHVGNNEVVLTVIDNIIDVPVEQQFTLTVTANAIPEFTSFPVPYAKVGKLYIYDIITSDADTEAQLTIAATTLPLWLTFTDNGNGTATLSGTPDTADLGDHANALTVTDGIIAQPVEQSFTISTSYDTTLSLKYPCGGETLNIEDTIPVIWTYNPDSLSYILIHISLDSGKTWHLISGEAALPAESNIFYWYPLKSVPDVIGKAILLRLINYGGNHRDKSKFISMVTTNATPEFISAPGIHAIVKELYTYDIIISDADTGSTLTITATTLPSWLKFTDNGTSSLLGIPDITDLGEHAVVLTVTDGIITQPVEQSFTIFVDIKTADIPDDNNDKDKPGPPSFNAAPNPVTRNNGLINFSFNASDIREARLKVYDAVGNVVYNPKFLAGRNGTAQWNLINSSGKKVTNGTYLAVLWLTYNSGTIEQLKTIIGIKRD